MKSAIKVLMLVLGVLIVAGGCNKEQELRWNEEAQRCQMVDEPYQFVDSSLCGR